MMMTSDGGRAAGIEGLFAAGQSLDQRDRWGKTPLFLAAARGDLQLVYHLLEKGAQADIADKQATTPLLVASKQGHIAVVERLLRCEAAAGLSLDMRDAAGRTPLFWAAHEGKLDVVSCLLGRGARADIPDKQGTLPLMRAAGKGHVDVVRLLLMVTPKAKVDEKDACGKTALSFAVDRGHVEVVHLLTRKGARLELTKNSWADGRGTLLHVAIDDPCMPGIGNRLAMVKALLQRAEGRVLDRRDRRGKTALHCATTNFEGHQLADVVALLLHKGARADITDNHGMTPLMVALRHPRGRCMVEMLLQKAAPGGLGLDARDRNGMTALHHAVGGAGEVVIKALLRHGASPFIQDNEGRPPNVLQVRRLVCSFMSFYAAWAISNRTAHLRIV